MKEWLIFILLVFVGVGMLIAGAVYRAREKHDPEAVAIYSVVSVIGVGLAAAATLVKFVI